MNLYGVVRSVNSSEMDKNSKERDENMIKVYLPDHSLQGSEIPFYMLWKRSENFDLIEIEYPKEMKILEIYNVSVGNFKIENGILYIYNVDVNGYLGIKFISIKGEAIIESNLHVMVYNQGSLIHEENKSIQLFRPDIKVKNIPKNISINIIENQNKIDVSNKIKITNNGLGTAILKIECLDDSDIRIYNPMSIDEFRRSFWEDVENNISKLRKNFPEYNSLLVEFVEIGKNPPIFEEDELNKIKILSNELSKAFEENEDFLKDFANVLLTSYLKNISIVTDLKSFSIYLKSVYESKIILLNAVEVMKISSEPKKLKAKIYVTDLAYNKYNSIDIDITIAANRKCEVPIYSIFDFSFQGGE